MRLRFWASLLIFIASYFPLAIIFLIKDLDTKSYLPQHPLVAILVLLLFTVSSVTTIAAVRSVKDGIRVQITKVSNRSADMFTYTIPYMISFYNFNLGDWKTLLSLSVFIGLMFVLSYRTQNMLINPLLAIAGYGLYDCQFKDGATETQGLLISTLFPRVGESVMIERLSSFLYVASTETRSEENHVV